MSSFLPSVGRLAEYLVLHKLPVYLQAVEAEALPELLARFDQSGAEYAAFEIDPADARPCWLVFASAAFESKPAQPLARLMGLRGDKAHKRDHMRAAGEMLAARAFGDSLRSIRLSTTWAALDGDLPLSF